MEAKYLQFFFATMLICLTAFSDEKARYYRYKDDRGTVTFTDNPASIPEKLKDKVQTIIMEKSENQGVTGGYFIVNQQGAKEECLDDNGHGETWWRNYIQSYQNRIKESKQKLEETRTKYFTDPTIKVPGTVCR